MQADIIACMYSVDFETNKDALSIALGTGSSRLMTPMIMNSFLCLTVEYPGEILQLS